MKTTLKIKMMLTWRILTLASIEIDWMRPKDWQECWKIWTNWWLQAADGSLWTWHGSKNGRTILILTSWTQTLAVNPSVNQIENTQVQSTIKTSCWNQARFLQIPEMLTYGKTCNWNPIWKKERTSWLLILLSLSFGKPNTPARTPLKGEEL